MNRKDLPLVLISLSSILSGVGVARSGVPSFWDWIILILCVIVLIASVWMISLNHKNKKKDSNQS